MSYLMRVACALIAFVISGCASVPPHHVRYLGNDIYWVSFPVDAMEEKYWKDPNGTIPAYMRSNDLVPPECTHGVTVIDVSGGGAPSASARVRCAGEYTRIPPHSVRYSGNGIYLVVFPVDATGEKFGKDTISKIPAYMRSKNLVPPECIHGITVIDVMGGGSPEATAQVRCARK